MGNKYKFHFKDYHLIKIVFNLNEKFLNDNAGTDGIEVNPKIEVDYHKDEKNIFVQLWIEFDNPDAPFNFHIGIVGSFEFDIDISNENMESVVNINCSSLLFPFLRETIADITRRAGFPPLILPPVNFINLYKERAQIEEELSEEQ
jgi:preprotein translocase subunit SecB